MNFIREILSEKIIDALGWTILHSLWQGLLIGILLLLLLYLYRHHNPEIRYNLSVFSLGLIFVLSVLTFIFYLKDKGHANDIAEYGIQLPDAIDVTVIGSTESLLPSSWAADSFQYLIKAIPGKFPLIITLWLAGVLIISLRMTGGFYLNEKLRKSCLYEIPDELQKRFLKLLNKMNIHRKVNIHLSSLVEIPSLIGYFKPVVLIPLSAVTHMPVEQLEAILAHELAHIRRHDYLVNVFQSFIEALFFYHPFVWMIQKRIRMERENCCDDIALSYSGKKITYIKALTLIQDIPAVYRFQVQTIGSDKYQLLNRIKRIIKREKMKTNLRDKLLAGFIMASAIIIILFNTGAKFISFNSRPVEIPSGEQNVQLNNMSSVPSIPELVPVVTMFPDVAPSPDADRDTSFKIKDNVIQRTLIKNGKEIDLKMRVEQGKVTELFVDGKKIPESDFKKYQTDIDKTLKDVKEMEQDLSEANQKLSQFKMQEISREIEENMRMIEEKIKEIDIEAIVDNIEVPEIDQEKIKQEIEKAIQEIETIDMEKIREEMEKAMQSVREEMKNVELPDMDELKMEIEKEIQELKEIDMEKIQHEIQEALSDIQIDKEEIQREIEKSLQEIREIDIEEIKREIENDRMDLENERARMNEMLEEIEKLELDQ